ncbi:hypothetical protein P7C70_g2429, partial [Phenoliferia sp. Uapishka_3]
MAPTLTPIDRVALAPPTPRRTSTFLSSDAARDPKDSLEFPSSKSNQSTSSRSVSTSTTRVSAAPGRSNTRTEDTTDLRKRAVSTGTPLNRQSGAVDGQKFSLSVEQRSLGAWGLSDVSTHGRPARVTAQNLFSKGSLRSEKLADGLASESGASVFSNFVPPGGRSQRGHASAELSAQDRTSSPLRVWARWIRRSGKSGWTLPVVVAAALLVKFGVGLGNYSGFNDAPIRGDFEAQRHRYFRKLIPPFNNCRVSLLLSIGTVTASSFTLVFAPFLFPPTLLAQVIHRIFPVARGLFEDKVANVWCALNVAIKLRDLTSPSVLAKLALFTTLSAVLPSVCGVIWVSKGAGARRATTDSDATPPGNPPTVVLLPHALFVSAMAFFLFSFQVHEKSILLPLMPLTMLLGGREAGYGRLDWEWAVLMNNIGVFSVDQLQISYAVAILIHSLELVASPPSHLPDLFTVLNLTLSAMVFAIGFLWGSKRLVQEGWSSLGVSK